MTTAYEDACRALMLSSKLGGPVTELIAKKIIAVARTGERDPVAMRKRALQELGMGSGQ